MTLTREEQKSVLSKVMESHQGVTLTEVKSNSSIKEELKLNLEFYNSLKEGLIEDSKGTLKEATGMWSAILSVVGGIKDLLTGIGVVKDFIAWVQKLLKKLSEKLGPQIDRFIPQKIQDLAKDGVTAVEKFIKWIYGALSYKTFATMFAMVRYRTMKPTDEQKKCMELAAKKAWKWLLISLVTLFVIKFIMVAIPVIVAAKATAATAAAAVAAGPVGLSLALKPIGIILAKIGHGSLFAGIFSIASAGIKSKQAINLEDKINTIEDEAKGRELDGFSESWDYCPLPQE
tara:strand:+ start:104 stop:967 length:864 start_codon:yes stop_codon:yes gene_type:complete